MVILLIEKSNLNSLEKKVLSNLVSYLNKYKIISVSNGDLSPEALRNYRDTFKRKIEKYIPNAIFVALGDIPLLQLIGKKGVSKNRGRLIENKNIKVIPTYPLNKIIENLNSKTINQFLNLIIKDILYAKQLDENKQIIPTKFYIHGTKEHVSMLKNAKNIALDTEFTSNKKLLCVGFCCEKGKSYVYLYPEDYEYIQDILSSSNNKWVAGRPTDEIILEKHGFTLNGTFYDVLTFAHIYDENLPRYSLESVTSAYTSLFDIKSLNKGQIENMENLKKEDLIIYNGADCDATYRIFINLKEKFLKKHKRGLIYFAYFMTPVQTTFKDVYQTGIPIDLEELNKVKEELKQKILQCEIDFVRKIPLEIKEKHEGKLQLTRKDLLIDLFFEHPKGLKLKPKEFTEKTGRPAITENHLKYFKNKLIKKYLEWTKLKKILDTYVANIEKYEVNGRLHPTVHFTQTVTGRTSVSKPSFQNFPKRGEYASYIKRIIKVPSGWKLAECDLAQSEIRIMGWIAQDKNILKALYEGIDIHTLTASIVNKCKIEEITKSQRQAAKCFNFGFLYGMQAKSFVKYAKDSYGIKYSLKEAEHIRENFFSYPNGYYALPKYHKKCILFAKKYGYIEQPLGRRRHLPQIFNNDIYLRSKAERQAINFPIQSFSSDLALLGLYLFHEKIKKEKLNESIKILGFIHDAILFMYKEDIEKIVLKMCKDSMEKDSVKYIKKYFKIDVGYPVKADLKTGTSMNNLKDYEEDL